MLSWHSILPLQTEWNFQDESPMAGSIRKTSQLGGSKIPLKHFYYLHRSRYCDLSWHSIHCCYIHWVVLFKIWCWPSTDKKQTWRSPDLAPGYYCQKYLPEFAKRAWLQSLSRTFVSTLGLLYLGLRNLDLDSIDVNPNDNLWNCSFKMVIQSRYIELRVRNSWNTERRWKSEWIWHPRGYSDLCS